MLGRTISAKHLDNMVHLQGHQYGHRINTKIASVAGHEYVQNNTSFPRSDKQGELQFPS